MNTILWKKFLNEFSSSGTWPIFGVMWPHPSSTCVSASIPFSPIGFAKRSSVETGADP